ncbi:phospholipase D-like domain-containing protein [Mycolicibacterium mengxianglii]|uniref:phospholipase D-like domain-containing protein n=1 Tax=Mycolicibacterium mengxianglii TaxID=2736649 RepID=UPI0018D1BC79|nr:phospholipase D-like domain-containing protein [Mycolicibacterium mengxianglii]
MSEGRLLIPGQTCWRVERAEQFASLIDGADYFRYAKAAMLRAQHRIILIGWDFDTRILFERGGKTLAGPNQMGTFLRWLVRARPELEIYLLRSNVRLLPAFEGLWGRVTPVALLNWLNSERLRFAIDGAHPIGAVPHQKIAVVDDALALCGGIDFTIDRWDTREHLDDNPFRRALGRNYGPRHEVAVAVDGPAARALGEQARDRWHNATGQRLAPVEGAHVVWPRGLEPILRNVDVGIARTLPAHDGGDEVREVEALNLAAIAAARHTIYLENQYLASRTLADALADRLREPDGPEVVLVMPRNSESRLEEEAMDSARHRLLRMLWAADEHDRLGVYWPVTDGGAPIYVHAKVLVADDRLLRIGSSNLNNRSMGFDSECDVAVEDAAVEDAAVERGPQARDRDDVRTAITAIRDELIGEHLGVPAKEFAATVQREGSFLKAVEALRGPGRTLRRFAEDTVAEEAGLLAENDLMDPDGVPHSMARSLQRWVVRLAESEWDRRQ